MKRGYVPYEKLSGKGGTHSTNACATSRDSNVGKGENGRVVE